jgi:MarR family transcriptional regulator for hemolysin
VTSPTSGSADIPLGRQLALTQKAVKEWADGLLAAHGSSLTTWIVLVHAAQTPKPGLSQKNLADNLSIGGPALVRHLDRLEAEGMVIRTRDAQDRRVMRITLTAKGRRHLDKLRVMMAEHDRQMREQLTTHEAQVLERSLAKLHAFVTGTTTGEGHAADHETDVA